MNSTSRESGPVEERHQGSNKKQKTVARFCKKKTAFKCFFSRQSVWKGWKGSSGKSVFKLEGSSFSAAKGSVEKYSLKRL